MNFLWKMLSVRREKQSEKGIGSISAEADEWNPKKTRNKSGIWNTTEYSFPCIQNTWESTLTYVCRLNGL